MLKLKSHIIHLTSARINADFLKNKKEEYKNFYVKIGPKTSTVDPLHSSMSFQPF
jgi:hypothetical protein